MKRGAVYMADLEPTKGKEQRGHRPVVIVSPDEFNDITGVPIVLPITNGGKFACNIGFAVELKETKTTGIIRCDQPRVLDLKARSAYEAEILPEEIMEEVLARLQAVFAF